MTYIMSMLNSSKRELKYQYFSFTLLIILITSLLFSFWNLYSQMTTTKNHYNLYLHSKEMSKKNGVNLKEALDKPTVIETKERKDGTKVGVVTNPLKYDYQNLVMSIYRMEPKHVMTSTLEWLSFTLFPFIFTLYGIHMATYDRKYKTIKIKAVQKNWNLVLLSKQMTLYLSSIAVIVIVLLLSYWVGELFYHFISQSMPVHDFELNDAKEQHVVLQFLLSMFICLFFSTMGFYLGILFKRFMIPAFIFLVYDFIVPFLGKYDLRNMISVLGHKLFDFKGNFQLVEPTIIPVHTAFILLILFVILSTILIYILAKRQSKYVI